MLRLRCYIIMKQVLACRAFYYTNLESEMRNVRNGVEMGSGQGMSLVIQR